MGDLYFIFPAGFEELRMLRDLHCGLGRNGFSDEVRLGCYIMATAVAYMGFLHSLCPAAMVFWILLYLDWELGRV